MPEQAVPLPVVEVTLDYADRVNFAFQQNAIPVIRRMEVRNHTGKDLHDVVCRFSLVPEWAADFEHRMAFIPALTAYTVTDLPVALSLTYLASLSDRVRGEIQVEVTAAEKAGGKAAMVLQKTFPVEVYSFDEWTGLVSLPEILAAFVTPNVTVVEQILSRAADLLGATTDSSALNGYQPKSKKRVHEILSAIYFAVREQKIRYSNPPANFEQTGQRVRFCEQIIRSKLATCLDLCLLFSALMEQAGLHPLILMHEGHAYTGCWLLEENFAEPTSDDLQSIRKRVELQEILLFETTLVCDGNKTGFDASVAAARQHLGLDSIFEYAIDIRRSRAAGIRPLPLKREEDGVDLAVAAEAEKPQPIDLPRQIARSEYNAPFDLASESVSPKGRIDHWKQQLLDLTLRNRLLNFRETKQTIPLVCPDPEQLEDLLALDEVFSIKEQSKLMSGLDPRSLKLQEQQFAEDPLRIHLTEELRAKRLRSSLTETELARRLLDLYRRTRMEMEESGANTLFLALGFLEWKEDKDSDRIHRAPILLIPVRLERKSVQQGFSLKRYDEDAIVNVTLLELLRRDFELEIPGVNPPPEEELGLDVARIFWLFQQAVKEMRGWEVHRDVWLAHFSFNKFLLWKDLNDRVEMLTKNAVVDHLVNKAGQAFFDAVDEVHEKELDAVVRYNEMFCPVSSDSSQLAAIVAASAGKNLVLHGPPGTGKSQTITNLISHCLALGKRVLFVAEKRAALEVVHRRLSQIGLGPFCLELHSNKSGKADVLRQFGESLDFVAKQTPAEWEHLAEKLETARAELNAYVQELHRVYPNRMSAYHCYSWLIAESPDAESSSDLEPLRIEGIEDHSQEHLEGLQQLCDDLQIRGNETRLTRQAKDVLQFVGASSWTPDWEDQATTAARELDEQCAVMDQALQDAAKAVGVECDNASSEFLASFTGFCHQLIDAPALPAAFVTAGNWQTFRSDLANWVQAGRSRDAARAALRDFDLRTILQIDLLPLEKKYAQLSSKPGFFNQICTWFLLAPVRAARHKGKPKWTIDDAPAFFTGAKELQATVQIIADAGPPAETRLGTTWAGGEADWEAIENHLTFGDRLHEWIERAAGESPDQLLSLRNKAGQLLTVALEMLGREKPVGQKLAKVHESWQTLKAGEENFRQLLQVERADALPDSNSGHTQTLRDLTQRVRAHRGDLQNWCRWQLSRQEAEKASLGPLLAAIDKGVLPLENLRQTFERAYRENFIRRLITRSEILREFWGEEHQERINAFNDLDQRYTQLTAQAVTARLASGLPRARSEECPRNTELGILQRERVKKARHKPVRKLFNEIPIIVPKLKPCFLMSPLSVAQYLDTGQDNFDIVVFDEASQIPVWDAVGAIARGKQVVIVGDPKQLPPTNFFDRSDADDETIDDGSIVDLESILDECLASGLPTYNLRWHYRSRREGLIAFSNRHYYENRLHTFPAPHSEDVGVRLVPVPDGYYDKGKSRTNPAEAEAIKQEVIRRLTDPSLSHRSIGIVTFSQTQQTLVMDKLDEARREHPGIEGHFGDEVPEPVFVKNLENVQGDERDVIFFSICYGPDQEGRLSMNFGPLNRAGGERRLNVAVTRAKHEIIVFSTLRSDQIDLSRTRAKGAEHLKAYLEYADRGPRALVTAVESAHQEPSNFLFETQVAAFLRDRGHVVHTRIGCSGYRIDLAIVAPDAPGHYLLGIECDGATYQQAATARDRDRLRHSVLESLGWRMHRLWSTDWWRSKESAGNALLAVIVEATEAFQANHANRPGPAGPRLAEEPHEPVMGLPVAANEASADDVPPIKPAAPVAAGEVAPRGIQYPPVTLSPQGPPELFYEPEGARVIKKQIHRIIEQEGPITGPLLMRRVMEEWQFSRTGPRIRKILAEVLSAELVKTTQQDTEVYWPGEVSPAHYRNYRTPTKEQASKRKMEDIPLEEMRNAILCLLERYHSYPCQDFFREVARILGIGRLTDTASSHLQAALETLIDAGELCADGGVIRLPE